MRSSGLTGGGQPTTAPRRAPASFTILTFMRSAGLALVVCRRGQHRLAKARDRLAADAVSGHPIRSSFISFRQFVAGEEEAQLENGCILGVGAVNSIFFDAGCPLLTDGTFLCISWIRGAHQFSQVGNGIFLLQG